MHLYRRSKKQCKQVLSMLYCLVYQFSSLTHEHITAWKNSITYLYWLSCSLNKIWVFYLSEVTFVKLFPFVTLRSSTAWNSLATVSSAQASMSQVGNRLIIINITARYFILSGQGTFDIKDFVWTLYKNKEDWDHSS